MIKLRPIIAKFRLLFRLILFNLFLKPLFRRRPQYNKRYTISICSIFKNEAPFIKEWIEFHLLVGIEHFYLYNNNSEDNFKEILHPYIEKGIVTLIDWPFQQGQIAAYKHFYDTYRNETQWVSFLDLDEFICPKYEKTILEWLKSYERYPVILIYWRMFGSSGKLEHDYNKLVTEQYVVSWDSLYKVGKCLINTDYDIVNYDSSTHHSPIVHYKIGKFKLNCYPINQFRIFVTFNHHLSFLYNENRTRIQINHYWSKAWNIYDKKRKMSDVYFKNNPKKEMSYFLKHEHENRITDYTIYRFLIQLKHKLYDIQ